LPTVSAARPGPPRDRRFLFFRLIVVVAIGVQIPLVWALGHLTGRPLPFAMGAAALTGAFLFTFVGPRTFWRAPGPARLYLVLWPFFIWWMGALLFALLVPFALAAAALLHAGTDRALAGTVAAAALGVAVSLRQRPRVRAVEVFVTDLPDAFDGYRIAQISDLHCGPFASARRIAGWVDEVNRLDADLVAVTGDLITSGPDYVDVVAEELGKLSGRDGVFAAMGNHDYFTEGELVPTALDRAGLTVLRNRGVTLEREGTALYVAGADDTWTRRHDLPAALKERPANAPVVLLAHDPALFPEAANLGVDLTLSGHTHGGQIGLPGFSHRLNLARVMTRFTTGIYRAGKSTLYVNRGLGTTGPPVRLAVAPEIALLTLRVAPRV
jgi:predicted MPP superfamily phosphohydrolase